MSKTFSRFLIVLCCLAAVGAGATLIGYALRDNMLYYYSPSDVKEKSLQLSEKKMRVGGLVKDGSVSVDKLEVKFVVTDGQEEVAVHYSGLLPALFREGQGMIALGAFKPNGVFEAESLLAKHDENYMPPEVAKSLKENSQ